MEVTPSLHRRCTSAISTMSTSHFFTHPKQRKQASIIHDLWKTIPSTDKVYYLDDLIREWDPHHNVFNDEAPSELFQAGQIVAECHDIILYLTNVINRRDYTFHTTQDQIHSQLASMLNHMQVHVPVLSQWRMVQAILSWTRGRHLLLMHMVKHTSVTCTSAWGHRFHRMGLLPFKYTAQWFQHHFVVYVKIAIGRPHYYVGSTSVSMQCREESRNRKMDQLKHQTFVSCEIALRYWHHTRSYHNYIPIVIEHALSKTQALAMEANFIITYQPQLNYPFIMKFLPTSASNEFRAAQAMQHKVARHFRSGLRVFKRIQKSRTIKLPDKCKQQTLNDLYDLGSNTLRRFKAMRKLWSPKLLPEQFYAYVRLSGNLDAQYRPRVLLALQRVARHQQWKWPTNPFPLVVPFLAQPNFQKTLQTYLQEHIHKYHQTLIPFHWPTTTIIEGKHAQIIDALHNWRKWHREFLNGRPLACPCEDIRRNFPTAPMVDGHVAGSLSEFQFPDTLQSLINTSAKDSYYPAKQEYTNIITQAFHKWAQKNECTSPLPKEFVDKVWPEHLTAIHRRGLHQFKDITQLRQQLGDLVIHCEDHHTTKLCVFCPQFYYDVIHKMVNDPVVFTRVDTPPTHIREYLPTMTPQHLRESYPWAFDFNARIPTSYGLLKRKKLYRKARPIISYSGTVFSKLFSTLGKLLTDLLAKTYPDTMGLRSIDQVFEEIHRYLDKDPEVQEAVVHNDDLVGFYVSVPHSRILKAVHHLLSNYSTKHVPAHFDQSKVQFTVDIRKMSKFRTIRGKAIRSSTTQHHFHMKDIVPAVELSLAASFFECMGTLYQQRRGSSIGSQCSPAICAIVVAVEEDIWMKAFGIAKFSGGLFIRYVDNRLICIPSHLANQTAFRRLLRLDFYGLPIELEECGNYDILGFRLDVASKTCTFIPPCDPHQFRSPKSAGSEKKILSGFASRLHLIYHRTFPKSHIPHHVQSLIRTYSSKGFTASTLHAIKQHVHKNHVKKPHRTV